MKARPDMFLSEDKIDHDGEIFDYIAELHEYLWRFIRAAIPGASGYMCVYIDRAVELAENDTTRKGYDE